VNPGFHLWVTRRVPINLSPAPRQRSRASLILCLGGEVGARQIVTAVRTEWPFDAWTLWSLAVAALPTWRPGSGHSLRSAPNSDVSSEQGLAKLVLASDRTALMRHAIAFIY